jgi:hypothetical protein
VRVFQAGLNVINEANSGRKASLLVIVDVIEPD